MSIFEYDQEKHMKQEREAAWEEGHREGHRSGVAEGVLLGEEQLLWNQIRKKMEKGKSLTEIAEELEETEEHIRVLIEKRKDLIPDPAYEEK